MSIVLTLHHYEPITFRNRDTPLFDRPLSNPGLIFTNTRTGKVIAGAGSLCKWRLDMGEDNLPTEANRGAWTTLFPEQSQSVETAFTPMLTETPTPEMSAAEMKRVQEQQVRTMKWSFLHWFEDGEVYQIGVSDGAGVREWIVGSLGDILETRKSGSMPTVRNEVIEFEVRETRSFEMKRLDRDGSLNWP